MRQRNGLAADRRGAMTLVAALALAGSALVAQSPRSIEARPLSWDELPAAIRQRLSSAHLDAGSFGAFRDDHIQRTRVRVRESDLDAAIYYALQSTSFTKAPPLEPAVSAKEFVESRAVPSSARSRLVSFGQALPTAPSGSRLAIFREVLEREAVGGTGLQAVVLTQYERSMRFLYEKEFVAAARPDGAAAVAALYRDRALSTDTSVEAGYVVHLGLGMLQAIEPSRRIRRVLIVGPGLDLAPRTGLLEIGSPQSYQPYAVIDSLAALGLARLDDLLVVGADVNDRVVHHLGEAKARGGVLTLVTGIGDRDTVTLAGDYRQYVGALGRATAEALAPPALPSRYAGHLAKTLRFGPAVAQAIDGVRLDIVTDRLADARFDLVVATNIFPYLSDVELTLALANIASMLAPGGVLLHNEPRPLVGDVTADLDLPVTHSRTAVLATVRGAATPLYDRVFVHVNLRSPRLIWAWRSADRAP